MTTEDSKTTAIVGWSSSELVPIEDIKKQMRYFEDVKAKLLAKDDMLTVTTTDKKTGVKTSKPYIKRSGWRKVALAFALSDRIVSEKKTERTDGSFVWHVVVEVYNQGGRTTTGSGACDTNERKAIEPGKSAWAHIEHDVYATAHTRAKNRAISDMVAGGIITAEELEPSVSEDEPASEPHADYEPDFKDFEDQLAAELSAEELSMSPLTVETTGNIVSIRTNYQMEGSVWGKYHEIMKKLGFKYIPVDKKTGTKAHWERGE